MTILLMFLSVFFPSYMHFFQETHTVDYLNTFVNTPHHHFCKLFKNKFRNGTAFVKLCWSQLCFNERQLRKQREVNLSCSSQDSCTRWDSPGGIMSGRKRRGPATDSSLTPIFLELKRAHETYLSDCPQNISLWLPQGSEP